MAQQPVSAEAIMAKYAAQFPNGIKGAEEAEIVSTYRTFEAQPTNKEWEKQIFLKLDEAADAAIRNLSIDDSERDMLMVYLQMFKMPPRDYKKVLSLVLPLDEAGTAKWKLWEHVLKEVPHKRH